MEIRPDFSRNKKQEQAIRELLRNDNSLKIMLYGGAATGGKSYLGCSWITLSALMYPGTRWVMGRSVLKTLKETTLNTLWDVFRKWKIEEGRHYFFNTKDNIIKFDPSVGGSTILLKDLAYYPSDPEYDSLGSLEITGAFVDEAPQVTKKAVEILQGRIRYRLTHFCGHCRGSIEQAQQVKFRDTDGTDVWLCPECGKETSGLLPKLLLTCNPSKGWLYMDFYKPWKEGRMPAGKLFIPAVVTDNPYAPQENIKTLQNIEDEPTRQRLYFGNWEYDDDTGAIMKYEKIVQMFENRNVPPGDWFITCDPARFGRDRTVIMVWCGWRVEQIVTIKSGDLTGVADAINRLSVERGIGRDRILVDEEGVGGGLQDMLGVKGYVASGSPMKEVVHRYKIRMNYANFRSQCYWGLANKINENDIFINTMDQDVRSYIVEELEQIRRKDVDKDGKFQIVPKQDIKDSIGRSPDFADCLAMRKYFDYRKGRKFLI